MDANNEMSLKREVWTDVCNTRDGKIVEKRSKQYNLDHGHYKEVSDLNKYIPRISYFHNILQEVSYFSFEDYVDKALLAQPFIESREKQIEKLNEEIRKIQEAVKKEDI